MRSHGGRLLVGRLVSCVTALALCSMLAPTATVSTAAEAGTFERHTFSTPDGTWDYMLYVPPNPRPRRPLVVFIPGALQTAEQAAYDTRWNDLAEREGFLVLYPEANLSEGGYFHFDDPDHQHRGRGAPLAIAGMTQTVAEAWRVDQRHIFVGGASNGAAMTNIMAATYPDLYAAAFALFGCPYKGGCRAGTTQGAPPEFSAHEIVREMGERRRVMPFLVMQGSNDPSVPPVHSERTVTSWLFANDIIDNGVADGSISPDPVSVEFGQVAGGHSYEVARYVGSRGRPLAEYWLIHGMRHAYPGGRPSLTSGVVVDPNSNRKVSASGVDVNAPDGTAIAYQFFLAHPMNKERY